MIHFDESRIRALVTQDLETFMSSTADLSAEALNGFVEAVMVIAVGTVRERLHAFNEASWIALIPPEILAACFVHLPFVSRLSASHVCRSWRAAAISAPELWSKVKPRSPSNSPELLHMALSRAGARLLHLDLDPEPPTASEAIYSAIAPFMHRIRYLEWHSEHPATNWDIPAPNMECFCTTQTITITERFLGGHEGRLRYLYLQCAYLPEICPVFATVTDLSIVLAPFVEGIPPSMLTGLFALFPCLDWLQIQGITPEAAHMLPVGQVPPTLRELSLQSSFWDYDLAPLYVAWDSGRINHVWLFQFPGIPPNLECVAKGAVRLTVLYEDNGAMTRMMFEHSPSVRHTVSVAQFDIADAVSALSAVQSGLANVHTVMISHEALCPPLSAVLAALPKLAHLFVQIMPRAPDGHGHQRPDESTFDWSHLACLEDLPRSMSHLRAVTLLLLGSGTPTPANADEAQALLGQLRALNKALPPVRIQGFSAEDVAGIDLDGLNVRFDFQTRVGDLRFHAPRELYTPCW